MAVATVRNPPRSPFFKGGSMSVSRLYDPRGGLVIGRLMGLLVLLMRSPN